MAQNSDGRMLSWVQNRDKARFAEHARKPANQARVASPPSAEERARIARELRFPNAGGLSDRPASPAPQRVRQSVDPGSPAALPQRGTRIRSAFDSEYTGSLTSNSDLSDRRDPAPPHHEPNQFSRRGLPVAEAHGQNDYGRATDCDDQSENARPSSRASDLSQIDLQAQRVLEQSRARRLQTDMMRAQDADSYPPTTSGRVSTPEHPVSLPGDSRPPTGNYKLAAERENGPDGQLVARDESLNAHKTAYIRQSAQNYQKQHARPTDGSARVVSFSNEDLAAPVAASPNRFHQNANSALEGLILGQDSAQAQPSFAPRMQPEPAVDKSIFTADQSSLLDYNPPGLHQMTFASLLNESFDFDPSLGSDAPNNRPNASIAEQLAHAIDLPVPAQRDILERIPQSDWPAIDTWFSEQFSALAEQRTQKRAERREIAREFEAQVARRFADVDAERESLKDALRGMKESGANVLKVGTPTPKRRREDGTS